MDITATDIESLYRNQSAHPNPMFDFITGFVPRRLRDLFVWVEYLYFNSAPVFAAIKKFSEYAITDITYETINKRSEQTLKDFHGKTLKIKQILTVLGKDRWIYGNAFFSVYQPFVRFLKCPHCGKEVNIENVDYRFKLKDLAFIYQCRKCKRTVHGKWYDRRIPDAKRIRIIRWDPKQMDINYNPITGESVYYYTLPNDLKERISKGDKHIISTMPQAFLKAARDGKMFKFAKDQIYHMKTESPAGIDQQWGFPPCTPALKLFFYAAILRKANEAICLDHMVPFRILSPAQQSPSGDPIMMISLQTFTQNLKDGIRRYRRDPLTIEFSPIPVQMTQIGGQGRMLLSLGEVKEAEDSIIAAIGIPREFLYGGLSFTGSAITLRMLENQLISHTDDLNEALQWITDKSCRIMGWESTSCKMQPPRFIDDIEQKRFTLMLNQGQQLISNTTVAELANQDLVKERERRKQETLEEIKFQQEIQLETQKMQNTLAQQVQQQSMLGQTGMQYDQQQIIAQADTIVEQLMQADAGTRKSRLHSLQMEDFVMYSVVTQRLEEQQNTVAQQAKTQARAS